MGYDFFLPGPGFQHNKLKIRILHEGSPQRTGHHLTFVCLPKFLVFGFNLKRKGFRRHCDHLRQGLPRFSVKNWYQWQQHCNSEIYRSRQGTVRVEPHSTVMNALLLVPHQQWSLQHHSQHEYFRSQHPGCKFSFFFYYFYQEPTWYLRLWFSLVSHYYVFCIYFLVFYECTKNIMFMFASSLLEDGQIVMRLNFL